MILCFASHSATGHTAIIHYLLFIAISSGKKNKKNAGGGRAGRTIDPQSTRTRLDSPRINDRGRGGTITPIDIDNRS